MRAIFSFKVFRQSRISNDDFKVLSLLYQPLIGFQAHSLFLVLYHLPKDSEVSVQKLMDILNFKNGDLLKAREQLEALSLLETYVKENTFIYYLKSPLSAKQFLTDSLLGTYLGNVIGDELVAFLAKTFAVTRPNIKDYKNVTKAFDEVYQVKSTKMLSTTVDLGDDLKPNQIILNTEFDFDLFAEKISARANKNQLVNSNIRNSIIRISFVYNYLLDDMVEVYNLAMDQIGRVTIPRLNLQARLYYQSSNPLPPEVTIKENNSESYIDKVQPITILNQYCKTDSLGIALDTVNQLIARNAVELGVVNVLIMTILKYKEGVLPNLIYLEKVLSTWNNKGIVTAQDALKFVKEQEKHDSKTNKYYNKTGKRSEPEWLKEYVKNIEEDW